ncbi:MAG TPA: TetR/AcrR family transcriptional regulator [Lachnospiraceae bacterium]|jgi:AcrR family transcriptional regulator|nr:TetR/AcrR family transcriptional regulator [Lachnospiraceae bacterium]
MMNKKISKRKLQAAKTKNNILETAKRLFLEHGIDNVSVDSIVEGAGVSKGAFYVHFESKDALASLIIKDYVNEIDMDYKEYLEGLGSEISTYDVIILMAGKIAEVLETKIGYENMKVLYKAHLSKATDTTSTVSYDREIYKMFEYILNRGLSSKEIKLNMPVDTTSHHLILAMRGITFEWCIRYPDFDLKKQFLEHFEILLNGIINEN